MSSGLRQRIATGLLLAALVIIILLWLPPGVAVLAVMVVVGAGAWEWAGLAGLPSTAARAGYTLAIGLVTVLAWWLTDTVPARIAFLREIFEAILHVMKELRD